MRKYFNILLTVLATLVLIGCADQRSNLVSPLSVERASLSKIISPYNYWTTYTYWDELYHRSFTQCTPTYSFIFMNYSYNLSYSRVNNNNGTYTNSIAVNVNGTYYTTVVWVNSDYSINPRTVVSQWFSVNGQNMNLSINVIEFYLPMQNHSEPASVRVAIMDGR